jgi:hypothetical protein
MCRIIQRDDFAEDMGGNSRLGGGAGDDGRVRDLVGKTYDLLWTCNLLKTIGKPHSVKHDVSFYYIS